MKFKVQLAAKAKRDILQIGRWFLGIAPESLADWSRGLALAIESLQRMPRRCGHAPDADEFDFELRQLIYGKRSSQVRILFTVKSDKVTILHIRPARFPYWKNG